MPISTQHPMRFIFFQQYMSDSTDSNMLKWWAQYTESTGDMNGALKIYQKAEDWFSQVI